MSTLIAVAYPDRFKAEAALATLQDLQRQRLIALDDAVIAYHEGDQIRLEQTLSLPAAGATGGALWGGLFGLIFLMPVVGMAVGAASGALAGKLGDYGIDDGFAKEIQARLGPGKAALVLLVRSMTADRVVAEMKKHDFGGEIVQTSLSKADEAKLRQLASA